uniref:Proline rich transmembrane protein 3 n=1 Tax=Chrysemys picta bellii TaxID=8478 RepID=A0A8C3FPK4_CHRPI
MCAVPGSALSPRAGCKAPLLFTRLLRVCCLWSACRSPCWPGHGSARPIPESGALPRRGRLALRLPPAFSCRVKSEEQFAMVAAVQLLAWSLVLVPALLPASPLPQPFSSERHTRPRAVGASLGPGWVQELAGWPPLGSPSEEALWTRQALPALSPLLLAAPGGSLVFSGAGEPDDELWRGSSRAPLQPGAPAAHSAAISHDTGIPPAPAGSSALPPPAWPLLLGADGSRQTLEVPPAPGPAGTEGAGGPGPDTATFQGHTGLGSGSWPFTPAPGSGALSTAGSPGALAFESRELPSGSEPGSLQPASPSPARPPGAESSPGPAGQDSPGTAGTPRPRPTVSTVALAARPGSVAGASSAEWRQAADVGPAGVGQEGRPVSWAPGKGQPAPRADVPWEPGEPLERAWGKGRASYTQQSSLPPWGDAPGLPPHPTGRDGHLATWPAATSQPQQTAVAGGSVAGGWPGLPPAVLSAGRLELPPSLAPVQGRLTEPAPPAWRFTPAWTEGVTLETRAPVWTEGLSLLPPPLQSLPLLAALASLQSTALLAADLLSSLLSPVLGVGLHLLSCACGTSLMLASLAAYWKLRPHQPAGPGEAQRGSLGCEDPQELPGPGRALQGLGPCPRVLLGCSALGLLCCGLQAYGALWLGGVLGPPGEFSWPWWFVQFWFRICELLLAFALCFVASHPLCQCCGSADHTCWAKLVRYFCTYRKAEAPEYPNNCYDWANGTQERAASNDISKSLIRNPPEQVHLRALRGSNEVRATGAFSAGGSTSLLGRAGASPKCPNAARMGRSYTSVCFEKESVLSLGELEFRPPSPINLSRSIDEALFKEHLVRDSIFLRSSLQYPGRLRRSSDPDYLYSLARCSSLSDLPSQSASLPPSKGLPSQPPTEGTVSGSSLDSFSKGSLKISWNPWRHGLSSLESLPLEETPSRAPLLPDEASGPSTTGGAGDSEREARRSFLALSKQVDSRSLSSDTIEL